MSLNLLNIASLWQDFQRTFYTEPLMFILNLLFVVLVLKHKLKDRQFRILMVYGIAALIQDLISFWGSLSDYVSVELYNDTYVVDKITIIMFILIEFYSFSRFFYYQFEDKPLQGMIKNISNILTALFPTVSIFLIISSTIALYSLISYLSVISSILLLVPCFYYFYLLFTDPPIKNLLIEPSFWITTGIAFLQGLNIPLFLINNFIKHRHESIWIDIYTINFVAYCFLFILFIIAIICGSSWKQESLHQTTPLTS
jgi:hypothetical protein